MTSHVYASGRWHVREDAVDDFVDRWQEFLGWTQKNHDQLVEATLIQATGDPHRFVSFAAWESTEARDAWRQSEEFLRRFTACRELCDAFEAEDFDLRVTF